MKKQPKKTAIVTGANVGLGFECARNLASEGWCVIMACRNITSAEQAAQTLRATTNNTAIFVEKLDLASLESVRSFTERIKTLLETKQIPPLRTLVNNAGLQMGAYTELTAEGHEMTFGVNHLGHFLLTHLLAPHCTAPARVVFVASEVHDPAQKLTIPLPPPYFVSAEQVSKGRMEYTSGAKMGQQRYSTSKLCNVLTTYSFAEFFKQEGREITVTAFNPGMMPGTALARKYDAVSRFAWSYILPVLRLFDAHVRTTEISGKDLAKLASDAAYEGITAKYYDGKKETPSSKASYDAAKQRDLWEKSLEYCREYLAATA